MEREILKNKTKLPVSSGKTISSYTSIVDGKEIFVINKKTDDYYTIKLKLNDDKLVLDIFKDNVEPISVEMKMSSTASKLVLYDNISLVFFIKKYNIYIIDPDAYELYTETLTE